MKKIFTLSKAIIAFFILMGIVVSTNAQEWIENKSNLYYIGSEGKVHLEPDYSSYAVYFKNDVISDQTKSKIKANFNREKNSSSVEMEVMDLKGMILVKSTSTKSIDALENPEEILKTYGLKDEGAYDVLPAFTDRGVQVFLTKRVSLSFKDGYFCEDFAETLERYGAEYQRKSLDGSFDVLSIEKIENQLPLIQELHEMGVLNWGGPDFKSDIKKFADPLYQYQWHLNNTGGTSYNGSALVSDTDIDAPEAWAITTGSSNITIAVIDDGIDNSHEDMPTPLTGYTPANNGDGTPSATDDGHGQLVAGLIFSQHDNNLGGKGVAPDVNYFSVNIFAPNTSNSDVADGITWAVNQGADILSNSWGWSSCTYNDASVTSAFSSAASNGRNGKGCLIFVASGNDFYDCVGYPANLSTVWAVGGISGDADRSNFSNYGPALDICAPSDDNWVNGSPSGDYGCPSTDRMGSLGWTSDNYYMYMGGTSGATPIVSGVAALVLSVDPTLTKSQAETILANTANSSFSAYNSNEFGAGMVNAYDAVVAAGGSVDTDPPTVPTGLSSSNVGSTSFDISWNASTDNVAVSGYNIYLDDSNIGNATGTSTSVTGLSPNTTYNVKVSAYDAAGNESAQSSGINVTTTEASLSCNITISSFPYSEGFESGDGWNQATGDDGDWVRDANGTPSSNTGPSSAVEGTYYMFLEASNNGSTGEIGSNATAILESDCFDLTGTSAATFSFQYHMYGSNVGSLTVQASINDLDWTNLWTLSGNQGDAWNQVDVDLASYVGGNVKLRMVGVTGSGWSSDIAIDDLQVTTGSGPDTEAPTVPTGLAASNTTQTTTDLSWNASTDNVGVTEYEVYVGGSLDGTTATTSYNVSGLTASTTYTIGVLAKDAAGNASSQATINVTTLDPVGGGCTGGITSYPYSQGFESGIGDWTQDSSDDLDWTVDANGTPSSSTGPSSADEGTYYIYVESSSPNYPSKVAILNSPCFDLTGESNATFSFAYHMYGSNMGTIELQASTDGTNWTALWTKSGDQGNSWYTENINLSSYLGTSVQLRYVATTGSSYRSDFAIDDINLTTGTVVTGTDLTLTITFDNYPEETSWTLVNSGGTTVASGGTYGSQADGSTLVIPINDLVDDCYDFTILDSYGDGICCSYGSGSYTLEVTGGSVIASGGSFTSSEVTNFCLPATTFNFATNIEKHNTTDGRSTVSLYPNPANTYITLNILNGSRIGTISIYNMVGIIVKTLEIDGNEKEIDISDLPAGSYIISIEDEKEPIIKQFIKR